jgi:hypothetical protein
MIHLDVAQNTPAWEELRVGIPTASGFENIITASGKPASRAKLYRNQLLTEWWYNTPIDWSGGNQFMERGKELEPKARAYYQFQHGARVRNGGFCLRDDRMAGCSPDGLIAEARGLEIKCPGAHTQIGYILDPRKLAADYHVQVQGSLNITGLPEWDLLAFHEELPPVELTVKPHAAFQRALTRALNRFIADLLAAREKLAALRAGAALEQPEPEQPTTATEPDAGLELFG